MQLYDRFWGTPLKKCLTVLGGAAVLALAVWGLMVTFDRIDRCATGVEKIGDECIGVNGSGYDFGTPQISKVSSAIAAENKRVEAAPGDDVTVAMMLPLQPRNPADREQLRSDLQGAYLAQHRANRMQKQPLMRLVLANPGKDFARQDEVVDELARMATSEEDNLRAVTGFNLSLAATKEAIGRLTNDLGIPVLASRVSADGLANPETGAPRYDGLARVIPTNSKQADALANFFGDLQDKETVLVKDTRPGDIYVKSLAEAFSRDEPGPPGVKDQVFTSPGITEPGDTANHFTLIGHEICRSDANVVYFAGRPTHLRLFALQLAKVPCHGKRYTVVSGSGAATLDRYMNDEDWRVLGGDGAREPTVTVEYVAPGHPDAWKESLADWKRTQRGENGKESDEPPSYLTEPRQEMRTLRTLAERQEGRIGEVKLADSRTMLVYDGVRTIAEDIFLAKAQTSEGVPSLEDVAQHWPRLASAQRVVGASGWICLTNAGNPYDKPVSVVELDPETKRLDFVGLAWSEDEPQPRDCVVPSDTD